MSSSRQIIANRMNALKSTGPTSEAGKRTAAANAVRHGLLSTQPVLSGSETAEEVRQQLAAIAESYAPQDKAERSLAERLALLTWQLRYVSRYVGDATRGAQYEASRRLATPTAGQPRRKSLHDLEKETDRTRGWLQTLTDFRDAGNGDALSGRDADDILVAICYELDLDPFDDYSDLPGFTDPALLPWRDHPWPVATLREYAGALIALAEQGSSDGGADRDPEDTGEINRSDDLSTILAGVIRSAQREHDAACSALADEQIRYEQASLKARLLPRKTLDKVIRYESHLDRLRSRTLKDLLALQKHRMAHQQNVVPGTSRSSEGSEGGAA